MANQTNQNDEIDLSQVTAKVKGYFTRVNDSFFDGILFIRRNIIVVAVIIALGIALGIYMDKGPKIYSHKVIVRPNFESVDYLYQAVEGINLKIKQKDTLFLKKIGIKKPKRISKINIEPIVDIYNFIDDPDEEMIDERKYEVFKVISENGGMNLKEMLNDPTTSRNYKTHVITITSKDRAQQSAIVDPVMNYLNSNPYFKQMQAENINNVNLKMQANDSIIKQVDRVIAYYTDLSKKGGQNLVYYNDNSQLTEAMKLKEKLIREQGKLRINKVNYTSIIKSSGIMLNEKNPDSLAGNMKVMVPLFFFVLFVIFMMMKSYYRSQVNKRKIVITE